VLIKIINKAIFDNCSWNLHGTISIIYRCFLNTLNMNNMSNTQFVVCTCVAISHSGLLIKRVDFQHVLIAWFCWQFLRLFSGFEKGLTKKWRRKRFAVKWELRNNWCQRHFQTALYYLRHFERSVRHDSWKNSSESLVQRKPNRVNRQGRLRGIGSGQSHDQPEVTKDTQKVQYRTIKFLWR